MTQLEKNKLEINLSEQKQRKNSTNKMPKTKNEIEKVDPEEVFKWDVEKLNAALKELNVKVAIIIIMVVLIIIRFVIAIQFLSVKITNIIIKNCSLSSSSTSARVAYDSSNFLSR